MKEPLVANDLWQRRGISLLWDAESLNGFCKPNQILSIRQFRCLYEDAWREVDDYLVNDSALVVAGLESCIDSLDPEKATEWLKANIYREMIDYQKEVARGGTEAALILWIADQRRLEYNVSESAWTWHCAGEHKNEQIPFGHCIYNGSQKDVQEIQTKEGSVLGLYHQRIGS